MAVTPILSADEITPDAKSVVDSVPGLVALLAHDGDVLFVNRRILEYTGKTLAELKLWTTGDTVHSEDLPRVIHVFTQSVASGTAYEIVQRLRRSDGVYRWFQHTGVPLRDATGLVTRWYVLLTDIDERRRAEALLAGEKRLLEMMASGSPLPTVLEALCTLVEENAANCHCGVYLIDQKDQVFQSSASPTLPPSFNDPLVGLPVSPQTGPCGMAASLKSQVIAADVETDPLWLASAFRPLALAHGLRSCWSTPIFSLTGDVLGTFAIYQHEPATPSALQQDLIAQVTHLASIAIERAQRETALRRSEAFLTQAQRLTLTGSLWWKVSTGEITWSDESYRIMGYAKTTIPTVGLILDRVHPDDLSLVQETVDRSAREGVNIDFEHRLLMPDGSIKYVHVVVQNMADEADPPEFVGAVTDITARKRAEDELRRAYDRLNRAGAELAHVGRVTTLSALTASIAHEVNQPLAGIITNAGTCLRMLDAVPPNIDGARETARRTIRDGNRASDVITRLRALFTKKEFTLEPLDLNDATREVIALSSNDLQRQHVILHAEFADDLPLVAGDRIQLQQVILNLLRNAADAMADVHDRPRHLYIRTEVGDGSRVRLTVRDVGVGLPPQSSNSLFDAFYTTKNGGMGIGLFVSRSIVESHRGRLWAESNADGPGATFLFSIPATHDTAAT